MLNSINMVVMDNTRGYEAVTIDQELTGKTCTYSYTMFNDTTYKLYRSGELIVVWCCVVLYISMLKHLTYLQLALLIHVVALML